MNCISEAFCENDKCAEDEGKVGKSVKQLREGAKARQAKAPCSKATGSPAGDFKANVLKANKTKKAYHEVQSTATSIMNNIRSQHEWSWAKNESNMHKLDSLICDLASSVSPFGKNFMCTDLANLKQIMSQDVLQLEVAKLPSELDPKIDMVVKETKRLAAMHAVNQSF